jgi:hypothetical protein
LRALRAIIAFLGGAMVGYALSLAAYVAYTELGGVFDREGAMGMGVAFLIGPVVALVCGVSAAILALRGKGPG